MKNIDDIKILIAENDVDEAADALIGWVKGQDAGLLNQAVLLKSQLKDFTKKEYLNLADSNTEKQRIVNGLLQVADEIERKLKPTTPPSVSNPNLAEDVVILRGQQDVIAVVWVNFLAFFSRDPMLYANTLHDGNPQNLQMAQNAAAIVNQDMLYQVKSMEVTRYDNYEAHVKTRVVTRARNNFQNSGKLTETVVIIRRNNFGYWKIWGWEVQEFRDA